jgi:hypothetical protein
MSARTALDEKFFPWPFAFIVLAIIMLDVVLIWSLFFLPG